jgi:uncharacterized protein (TIGR02271 family)
MKDIYDYDVYDRSGEKVGTVENVWAGDDKEIAFIGIRTGWLGLGKNHLIPSDGFTIDEQTRSIRVPYDEDTIKSSPSFSSTEELEDDVEANVYSHFDITGRQRSAYASNSGLATGTTYSDEEERAARQSTAGRYSDLTDTEREKVAEGETVEVPLAEERLHVEKRERDLGKVRLRKVVRTETVNQPIELRHEEVVVERVRDAAPGQPGEDAFTEKVVTIPVREEEAVVEKSIESAGAVRARKVVESERQNVSETIRKEDVEVERDYEAEVERDYQTATHDRD